MVTAFNQTQKEKRMPENPLHLLMNPKSIAIAGANNNPMKMGTMQALSIIKDGYQGTLYPIHPTEKNVLGHQAYASVCDLPEAPDLAILVVPTRQVISLLEEFGRIGTRRAVVITAGFRETGEDDPWKIVSKKLPPGTAYASWVPIAWGC